MGFGYRYEHGDNRHVFQRSPRDVQWFLFEQQFRFFDRLFITGGFRIEDNSVFGTATTGRGSVSFVIKETGTRLRGSAGTGFRAPTFNDLFFPGFGNPDLQAGAEPDLGRGVRPEPLAEPDPAQVHLLRHPLH